MINFSFRVLRLIKKIKHNKKLKYKKWVQIFDALLSEEIDLIVQDIKTSNLKTKFLVYIIEQDENRNIQNTLNSLNTQLYKNFDIFIGETKNCLQFIKNPLYSDYYLIILPSGSLLSKYALYWMAKEIETNKPILIYSDHDYIDIKGTRKKPHFKPDFSLEYLRSTDYINFSFAVKMNLLKNIEIMEEDIGNSHAILLKIVEKLNFSEIRHIPAILFHFPENLFTKRKSSIILLENHFKRLGINAEVQILKDGCYKIIYHPKSRPLISIIIPTKDNKPILENCIKSILNKTTYKNYEILIVDNQSSDYETVEYLKYLNLLENVKILRYNAAFNFSAINNFAANYATGEVIVFLNNDTEVITPQWLEIMLGCLEQPRVGAVGVKLLYPNGTVQHAGVIIGLHGTADHLFKGYERWEEGYMCRAILQQDLSAVTGACLMTWKRLFEELKGFDEVNLPITFNDVDYCLRLRSKGYRIIFTPYVELYHHESLTRGKKHSKNYKKERKNEALFIRNRWGEFIKNDPFYNPNLELKDEAFTLILKPRIKKPWKENER